MDPIANLIAQLSPLFGREIHVGPWLQIDQARIDRFAEVTGDHQWIHVEPERARRESPYGTTVAHGYLTLSLLPYLTESLHPDYFSRNYPGMRFRVNYGLNCVRFPAPVRAGDRIRAHTVLIACTRVEHGVEIIYRLTVVVEGQDKPACVAEYLSRVYP